MVEGFRSLEDGFHNRYLGAPDRVRYDGVEIARQLLGRRSIELAGLVKSLQLIEDSLAFLHLSQRQHAEWRFDTPCCDLKKKRERQGQGINKTDAEALNRVVFECLLTLADTVAVSLLVASE